MFSNNFYKSTSIFKIATRTKFRGIQPPKEPEIRYGYQFYPRRQFKYGAVLRIEFSVNGASSSKFIPC
jgi:hypothetical protein